MAALDSSLDTVALGRARALLKPPMAADSLTPLVLASAFAALTALTLAGTVLIVPPVLSPGTRGELPETTAPRR